MNIAVIGSTGLVGSQLDALAESEGHVVTGVARETGIDLLVGDGLDQALTGVEVVVDVTQSPSFEREAATAFFTKVAENLGAAAQRAGVSRSVVLSIIGVDKVAAAESDTGTGFDGYYSAKYAQELAARAHLPGAHVVRSAQFHDIAGQAIGWGRDGARTTVPDLTVQPLAVAQTVRVLLDVATGGVDGDLVEVAGPGVEHLAAMSTAFARHVGDEVDVVAAPVGDAVRDGILLPGAEAILGGPRFRDWLASRPAG